MRVPVVRGVIDRRPRVNCRVDPAVLPRQPRRPGTPGSAAGCSPACTTAPTAASTRPGCRDCLELRSLDWRVEPLAVDRVRSSRLADAVRFPPGSVAFDAALRRRGIGHQWLARAPLRSELS